jgi:hypothetical protein
MSLTETEFSILDNYKNLENNDTVTLTKNFKLSVEYICQLNDIRKILNEKRSINAFTFIRLNCLLNQEFIKFFIEYDKIIEVLKNILDHYTSDLKKYPIKELEKLELTVLNHVLSIILVSTDDTKSQFSDKFHDIGGTTILQRFIEEEPLLTICSELKRDFTKNGKQPSYLRSITSILLNLSKIADDRKHEFALLKVALLNFLNSNLIDDDFRMCTSLTLANLFKNCEIETLPHSKMALNGLVQLLNKAAYKISTKQSLKRSKFNIDINGEFFYEDLCLIEGSWCDWRVDEILIGLYRISMNDKIKFEMFETIKEDISKIILNGNDSEKVFAMRLLCQLCFDEKVGNKVKDDKDLYKCLESFTTKNITNTLHFFAKNILWTVDKNKRLNEMLNKNKGLNEMIAKNSNESDDDRKHIMISYNHFSQEICLRLKETLVEQGYKVWIDVEQIAGSSLISMAKAVENSFCVLICMTEKYYLSTYCRSEAEYTYVCKVPFIPLILQPNFTADGWLSMFIGSYIYADYYRYGFDKFVNTVISQLDHLMKREKFDVSLLRKPLKSTQIREARLKAIKKMTTDDIEAWLLKVKIDEKICKTLKSFNGKMLNQLYYVKTVAPNYFLNAISRNTTELLNVLLFTSEFDKLYEFN